METSVDKAIRVNYGEKQSRVCSNALRWSYPLDGTVSHFVLLRSRDGSTLHTYAALPLTYFFPDGLIPEGQQTFEYTDEQADADVRYVYVLRAEHQDGGYSPLSSPLTIVTK